MRSFLTSAIAVAAIGVLGGCSAGPYDFETEAGTGSSCQALIDAAPDAVLEEASTPVDSPRVAAWGDPRITLRCGVTQPESLLPTSRCDDVDGVGWFTEDEDGAQLFTTIGRNPNVSMEVPSDYEPAGAALIDVGDLVKAMTRDVEPCV
ncbi:DUF3515 domain-containing protein [Aeromicrobium sp. CF3.5]|uniref:DUF3515 domain-containing protein n=1 Tax=Aeromicrobium sp. CF3.5 TaxID=3373078 RepID=UPI003EE65B83